MRDFSALPAMSFEGRESAGNDLPKEQEPGFGFMFTWLRGTTMLMSMHSGACTNIFDKPQQSNESTNTFTYSLSFAVIAIVIAVCVLRLSSDACSFDATSICTFVFFA